MKPDTRPVDFHAVKAEKMKTSLIEAIETIKEGRSIPMTEKLPGWVQKMMGHETLQMIHDRYYSYIKNYQREDGSAFIQNVYYPSVQKARNASKEDKKSENFTPNLHQTKNGELVADTNSPNSLKK